EGWRRCSPPHPLLSTLRRRARHQPEAVELVEGNAVPRLLPAREAGAAPWTREPHRRRAPGARNTGRGTATTVRARRGGGGHRGRLDALHARLLPAALARGARLAHAAAVRARSGVG